MNKLSSISRIALAIALLFAVNMEADAQFGKLKNLAKKAKEVVSDKAGAVTDNPVSSVMTDNSTSSSSSASSNDEAPKRQPGESDEDFQRRQRRYADRNHPHLLERYDVEDAGGLQQYLGLTEGDGLVLWNRYNALHDATATRKPDLYSGLYPRIIDLLRILKNPYYDSAEGQPNYWTKHPVEVMRWIGYIDNNGNLAGKIIEEGEYKKKCGTRMNQNDMHAVLRYVTKSLKEFEAKYGKIYEED